MLHPTQLATVLTKCGVTPARAAAFACPLNDALRMAECNTPLRVGHALAQVLHESVLLAATGENLNYSAAGLRKTFRKYFPNDAIAARYARQPRLIASRVYANRYGNGAEGTGDGWKYRGRGIIQLTFKNNYKGFHTWLRANLGNHVPNVVADPDVVANHPYSSLTFAYYWSANLLNRLADGGDTRDDVKAVTRAVNGGYNGLEDRIRLFVVAMAELRKLPTFTGINRPL